MFVLTIAGVDRSKNLVRHRGGRMAIDKTLLKVPLLGLLLRKIAVARFTRTLGTLITSGVPILEGWRSPLVRPATR